MFPPLVVYPLHIPKDLEPCDPVDQCWWEREGRGIRHPHGYILLSNEWTGFGDSPDDGFTE